MLIRASSCNTFPQPHEIYDPRVAIAHPVATVADVMLRHPKTLAADATVSEREALESQSTHMLLLVDGERFRGAVTATPADADPDESALGFVDRSAPIVTEDTPVSAALARLEHRPERTARRARRSSSSWDWSASRRTA